MTSKIIFTLSIVLLSFQFCRGFSYGHLQKQLFISLIPFPSPKEKGYMEFLEVPYEKIIVHHAETKHTHLTGTTDSDWVIHDKEWLLEQDLQSDTTKSVADKKTAIDKMIINLNKKKAKLEYARKLAEENKKGFWWTYRGDFL